jgi:hypothetical protein
VTGAVDAYSTSMNLKTSKIVIFDTLRAEMQASTTDVLRNVMALNQTR